MIFDAAEHFERRGEILNATFRKRIFLVLQEFYSRRYGLFSSSALGALKDLVFKQT
jgi:hypothetical protein